MLPESKNIQTIADNIRSLEKQINTIDVEIPPHVAADAGKYLGVDSSGDLEFSKPLPETTGALTGDVLGLTGEGKILGWITPYTPRAYSSTEEVNTGQKWIDGKDVYFKVFSGTFPVISSSSNQTLVSDFEFDSVIDCTLVVKKVTTSYRANNIIQISSNIVAQGVGTLYSESDYYFIIYYTKPDPGHENLSKKKGTKK